MNPFKIKKIVFLWLSCKIKKRTQKIIYFIFVCMMTVYGLAALLPYLYIYFVPVDGPEYSKFESLNVQNKQIDCGII